MTTLAHHQLRSGCKWTTPIWALAMNFSKEVCQRAISCLASIHRRYVNSLNLPSRRVIRLPLFPAVDQTNCLPHQAVIGNNSSMRSAVDRAELALGAAVKIAAVTYITER